MTEIGAFRVLGPLEVVAGGAVLDLGGPRLRAVLALLLAADGRTVSIATLVSQLWGDHPPGDAERTVRAYVSRLRKVLDGIVTQPPGYRLQTEGHAVDAAEFERLAASGRLAQRAGQPAEAAEQLAQALALWRGEAYAEFDQVPALVFEAQRLNRLRLTTLEERIDADLATGLGADLVGELETLTREHPGNERLWGQLMTALYRSGRQADALEVFAQARTRLVEEYGLEPSPLLIEIHRQVLGHDPELQSASAAESKTPPAWPVPNQLPAATRHFTGRGEQLARLLQPLDGGALVVTAVDGMAGIGKTALAVHAAHQLADSGRYPDGALFVDLHGYSGRTPTGPEDALETLLRGLGVPGPSVPPDTEARAALYRTITAQRRVLIVLDNARNEAQVRPLLPGAPTCLVLVTSRRRLAGLDDAEHLTLDTLPVAEAADLFETIVGAGRDPGDPQTVAEIVELCGLLPLAIRIAGGRLKTSRALTGRGLLEQLREARIAVLDDGDRSVTAALRVSYQHLPADQQRALGVLGLHPGVEFEPYAAAALLGTSLADAGRLLAALEQVNLLDQPTLGRYRFHDLTRLYVISHHQPEAAAASGALARLYDHYASTASAAMGAAYPYEAGDRPAPPASGTPAPEFADQAAAIAWLDSEQANLLALARYATTDQPRHTMHQSATLHRHLRTRGAHGDALTLHQAAADLARAADDRPGELDALNSLGSTHYEQGRYEPAAQCHTRALELALATGSKRGQLRALNGLGWTHHLQARYDEAVGCHARAVELARELGNQSAESDALNGLGWTHYMQGTYGSAADCHTQALELARTTGDPAGEIEALIGLGWTHYAPGRYAEATDCYQRALDLARATGNVTGEIDALHCLGTLHSAQGKYAAANGCHAPALELSRAIGNRNGEMKALTGLAYQHFSQRHYAAAREYSTQMLELARALGSRNGELTAYTFLGHIDHAQSLEEAARERYGRALELALATGSRNMQLEARIGLGRTHQATGDPAAALVEHQLALELAVAIDQFDDQVRAHDGLAQAYRSAGEAERARYHWRQAIDILTTLDTPIAGDVTAADIDSRLASLDIATRPFAMPLGEGSMPAAAPLISP